MNRWNCIAFVSENCYKGDQLHMISVQILSNSDWHINIHTFIWQYNFSVNSYSTCFTERNYFDLYFCFKIRYFFSCRSAEIKVKRLHTCCHIVMPRWSISIWLSTNPWIVNLRPNLFTVSKIHNNAFFKGFVEKDTYILIKWPFNAVYLPSLSRIYIRCIS